MIPRRRGSRETVRLGRVVPGRPGSSQGLFWGHPAGTPGFVPLAEALWWGRAEPSAHSRSKAKAPPRCLAGGPGHSRRRPGPCSSPPHPGYSSASPARVRPVRPAPCTFTRCQGETVQERLLRTSLERSRPAGAPPTPLPRPRRLSGRKLDSFV